MGEVLKYHPKFLDRLADVYLKILREQGPIAADEYTARHLDQELIDLLTPIVHAKSRKK